MPRKFVYVANIDCEKRLKAQAADIIAKNKYM